MLKYSDITGQENRNKTLTDYIRK